MKDYYAILGVVPSAEDVVIRAAWKALAQRYHPDRFAGNIAEANARMAEINEAYNVLSDSVQRKAYDESRGTKERDFSDWVHEEEADQAAKSSDPLEKDWALAVGFYPDLVDINNRLSKISKMLAFSYRASMLEYKAFEKRHDLAQVLEMAFLQSYFGSNPEIINFARLLIFAGNKAAAKALNDSIRVLGSDVPSDRVISKIRFDFKIETEEMRQQRTREEAQAKRSASAQRAREGKGRLAVSDEDKQFLNWCCWGNIDKVKEAIDKNPPLLKIVSDSDNTALHYAVIAKQQDVTKFLAEKGAHVFAINNEGKTPIDLARSRGMEDMAQWLENLSK